MSDQTNSLICMGGNISAVLFGSVGAMLSDGGAWFSGAMAAGGLIGGILYYRRGLTKKLDQVETELKKALADLLEARTAVLEATRKIGQLEDANERLMKRVQELTDRIVGAPKPELKTMGERLAGQ